MKNENIASHLRMHNSELCYLQTGAFETKGGVEKKDGVGVEYKKFGESLSELELRPRRKCYRWIEAIAA